MNTLFVVNAPLGDSVIFSCLLKDYKEMFPNETLYILHNEIFIDLFKNNSLVNIYDKSIKYDKVFDYNLYELDKTKYSELKMYLLHNGYITLQDTPYFYFDKHFNIKLYHNNYSPCIELDDYQKQIIESDKPICILNNIPSFVGFDSRYYGNNRYQKIVNDFKDKINFICVGNTQYNQILQVRPLENLWQNLVNKTTIYELLKVIYNSDICISHESGLLHLANIVSDKRKRCNRFIWC